MDSRISTSPVALLADLQKRYAMSYLFISHDLAVIRAMAHRVLVMKDGRVVEQGSVDEVLSAPKEAYTQRLLAASTYSVAAVEAL